MKSIFKSLLFAVGIFLFTGCKHVITVTKPDGTVTTVESGFGNRIKVEGVEIEPSEEVVKTGENLGREFLIRSSDALINKAMETAIQTNNIK